MANNILTAILIFGTFIFAVLPASGKSNGINSSTKISESTPEAVLKKYGSHRPKTVLSLKDTTNEGAPVELDNKYFKISYPVCFKVRPTIEDSDDVNIKNSASIDLSRNKECIEYDPNKDSNSIHLRYDSHYIEVDKLERFEAASNAVYRQMVTIGPRKGVIFASVGLSSEADHWQKLRLGWTVVIECKGIKNELFRFTFLGAREDEAVRIVDKKDFQIPSDFGAVVSSFRCKSDR